MKAIGNLFLCAIWCWISWITSLHCAGLAPHSDYITYYEGLEYDTDSLHASHERVRRSAALPSSIKQREVRLSFNALNRDFRLRLRRDASTFVSRPEIVQDDGSVLPLDTSHIYEGELEDVPRSYVHGSIIDGIFSGRIDLPSGITYYVDKTEVHFSKDVYETRHPFHSIIYAEHDVIKEPKIKAKPFHGMKESNNGSKESGCPLSKSDIYRWMERVQKSAVNTPQDKKTPDKNNEEPLSWENVGHQFYNTYSQSHGGDRWEDKRRRRDASTNNSSRSANRVCAIFLQSDPMLWNYLTNGTTPTGANYGLRYTPARARDEITALFASHVSGMKKIYQRTVFQWGTLGPFTSISFVVYRIQINTSYGCANPNTDNPYCQSNIDVANFLNMNSLTNQDLYCSAFIFTYRDFSGTLGLAWVGSATGAAGGICEKFRPYSDGNGVNVYKSLNTGVVSLLNYGTRVPTIVSTLTFSHEMGHNFGSPHDVDPFCAPTLNNPNDPNGNYIMFASATTGTFPNNHNFSTCSIGNMTQVINAVLTQAMGKINCFTESDEAFCGNRIQEVSEQCDCGFTVDCNNPNNPDTCCYPEESPFKCRLKPNASCSASEGPCCVGSTCGFVTASSRSMCFTETECSYSSFCNGLTAKCPAPGFKANLTLCNSNTQLCHGGSCFGSVCELIGWSSCSLDVSSLGSSPNLGLLCYVACSNPATGSCVATNSKSDLQKSENSPLLALLTNLTLQGTGIRLPAGMPCNNNQGYCDVFQICRAVNEEGPLARLQDIFSGQSANDIRMWITSKWWAVLLMIIGLVILMGLFIKVCAVHTPSSNPKLKAARQLTLPRRQAPRAEIRAQGSERHPPPYSSESDRRSVAVVNGGAVDPPHLDGAKQTGDRPAGRSQRHGNKSRSSAGNARLNSNLALDTYPTQVT